MPFQLDGRFEWFLEQFGNPQNAKSVPKEIIEKYANILPSRLLEYWSEYGFCSFKDGLFWLVNPDDYQDSMIGWLKGTGIMELDSFHVIARTGFGSMLLWGKKTGQSWTIDINDGELFHEKGDEKRISEGKQNESLQGFFAVFSPESADLKDVDTNKPIFEQAVKKFGPLEEDEMFTFEPALFLGGEQTLKTVSKVNFFIQSDILASMGQREIMDIKGLTTKAFGG
jgi:hypothetical protein